MLEAAIIKLIILALISLIEYSRELRSVPATGGIRALPLNQINKVLLSLLKVFFLIHYVYIRVVVLWCPKLALTRTAI